MFKNLEAEISRRGIKKGDIARMLNIQATTLSNKLSGKSELTMSEAIKIKQFLGVNMPLEELFAAQRKGA